ncbi:MAG: 50S ribosomal protein L22 [Verrucomicrobiota bacterium]|nr:50S ribosomal protein L22 [Verrucomicrobiota bacterium]
MEVQAIQKYARISHLKARQVAMEIQGLPALQALDIMKFSPKKAARIVYKTLKSAIANAENNNSLDPKKLVVKESVANTAGYLSRFRPKARGSAGKIRKRFSHFKIVLSDGLSAPESTESNNA